MKLSNFIYHFSRFALTLSCIALVSLGSARADWEKLSYTNPDTGLEVLSISTEGTAESCPKTGAVQRPSLIAICTYDGSQYDEGFRFGVVWPHCDLSPRNGTSGNRVEILKPDITPFTKALTLVEGGEATVITSYPAQAYINRFINHNKVTFRIETAFGDMTKEFNIAGMKEALEPLYYHCGLPVEGKFPWEMRKSWDE
ncbi:hypothetical protein [Pseudovibrio sp. WM33]|uniref:hypothetical protein n=1 Tax=Pseudovibrio sp. WM33 TaxID=1735585 RepID=UPI0007AEA075|nr:hypothetical protein [Pseudovibrio sp. WM33]KZL28380.1 hypothetical protein PsWM33_00536 [Pseudovibrio sp. WM33]